MKRRSAGFGSVLLLLTFLAVTAVSLLLPTDVSCDASGCSRVDNTTPTAYGCAPRSGSACYECYYSQGGGTSMCFESVSGSLSYCIDYQW